jgi:hypothetical protein
LRWDAEEFPFFLPLFFTFRLVADRPPSVVFSDVFPDVFSDVFSLFSIYSAASGRILTGAPHLSHATASSGSLAPHFPQNIFDPHIQGLCPQTQRDDNNRTGPQVRIPRAEMPAGNTEIPVPVSAMSVILSHKIQAYLL